MFAQLLGSWDGFAGLLNLMVRFIALSDERCGKQASRKLYQIRALLDKEPELRATLVARIPKFDAGIENIETLWAAGKYGQATQRMKACVALLTEQAQQDA